MHVHKTFFLFYFEIYGNNIYIYASEDSLIKKHVEVFTILKFVVQEAYCIKVINCYCIINCYCMDVVKCS